MTERRPQRTNSSNVALLVSVVLLVFSTGCRQQGPEPDEIIEYKQVPGKDLTLHVFYPPKHNPGLAKPAVVFFFGGGWRRGTPEHFYPQSQYLASRGMVAICADYRTSGSHGTSPQECVKDGKSAIRWIREHAARLGIDPERLAAGGGSAGGHVAAATATLSGFNEAGEDTTTSCVPNALLLFNPVFDNSPDGYGHERVGGYWQAFSPLHNLHDRVPPAAVFLGTEDHLIPAATGENWRDKMQALGLRCDLHLYPGQGHGFFNKARFFETLVETDKFLASLGYLQGEPTLKRAQ